MSQILSPEESFLAKESTVTGRRRVPRRNFEAPVGVLHKGKYTIERSYQVGEGGVMISSAQKILVGTQVVTSFYLNTSLIILVRGVVRSVIPAKDRFPERYGIEYLNLGFHFRREIRNFVAAATRIDGPTSL